MLVLAYYLSLGQKFDAVINIDGFNEVVFGMKNAELGIASGFPNSYQWTKLARIVDGEAAGVNTRKIVTVYHEIASVRWSVAAERCRAATCYVIAKVMSIWHALGVEKTPSAEPTKLQNFAIDKASTLNPAEAIAEQWSESVRLMWQMLESRSIPFLEILQPNQWYFARERYQPRQMDEFSKEIAQAVPIGYPFLLKRIPELQRAGVTVLDETRLFHDQSSTIYSDDCCHFTPKGNEMILNKAIGWLMSL